jgi:hypothetical protein
VIGPQLVFPPRLREPLDLVMQQRKPLFHERQPCNCRCFLTKKQKIDSLNRSCGALDG